MQDTKGRWLIWGSYVNPVLQPPLKKGFNPLLFNPPLKKRIVNTLPKHTAKRDNCRQKSESSVQREGFRDPQGYDELLL